MGEREDSSHSMLPRAESRPRKTMQRSTRKRHVRAYCAGVLGVHAVVYKGVVVDVKNVIGIVAVVMGMWWSICEWSNVAKWGWRMVKQPSREWPGLK